MSVVIEDPSAATRSLTGLAPDPRASRGTSTAARLQPRTITIGLLGLGQVGQAVARLAPDADRLREHGLRVRVAGALVRDIDRPRRCVRPKRMTTNPAAFLRGRYDAVVEVMGSVEPASTIVARLLGRGVPVVSANKALVAAHGARLEALAARRRTWFRYEASALAGIPLLGTLAARPLVSDVTQFTAVVNGTSNFILTTIDRDGGTFESALAQAAALGLTEPDPSRDLDGQDAADKLSLLATLFGWGTPARAALEIAGIRDVTAADLDAARLRGATIKPVVFASRGAGIEAFVGPALVPDRHPLAALSGALSGIQLSGRFVSDLFFSGPGAGPEVTAATILDDVVEAVSTVRTVPRVRRDTPRETGAIEVGAPATKWFIRARFPGLVPEAAAVTSALAAFNLQALHVSDASGDTRWVRVDVARRDAVAHAVAGLAATHRIQCAAFREV